MAVTNIPIDVEKEIRALLVDVPGVGPVPLGGMTPDHHRRYHDQLAREVDAKLRGALTGDCTSRPLKTFGVERATPALPHTRVHTLDGGVRWS